MAKSAEKLDERKLDNEEKSSAPPKEMPRFGSTATFGATPLPTFGASFGRAAGSSFFNIAPSFGNDASFPSFLKLSAEKLDADKSTDASATKSPPPPAPAPTPKAPPSLDFFSSTTTSITFNMPAFKWGNSAAQSQASTTSSSATSTALFGVNPEKPSALPEKEEDEEGDGGDDVERPPSPTFNITPTILKPTEPIVTGEEDEVHVHQAKAKLYRLDTEDERTLWKERGVGQVRINCARNNPLDCRIVMRVDGALKLILNSKIFATMPARLVGESSVALSAMSEEGDGKPQLYNFLLKLQGRAEAELLLGAIEVQKQKIAETSAAESERGVKRAAAEEREATPPAAAQSKASRKVEKKEMEQKRDDGDQEEEATPGDADRRASLKEKE